MVQLFGVFAILIIGWVILSTVLKLTFALIIPVLVAMFIGWLAGKIMRGQGYGPLSDALLGIGGGIIGTVIFGSSGLIGGIITGTIGAIILIFAVRLVHDGNFGK